MIKVYINYPNPHVTIHSDPNCGSIQAQRKPNQRYIKIDSETVSRELQNFRDKKYIFEANPEWNDMWLEIAFLDQVFEQAVLAHICRLLGNYYTPLEGMMPKIHC